MNLLFVLRDDRYLHVWYYPVVFRAHPRCLGAPCCVGCSFHLGCIRLVSYCESLWWPMYERCTGVCSSCIIDGNHPAHHYLSSISKSLCATVSDV